MLVAEPQGDRLEVPQPRVAGVCSKGRPPVIRTIETEFEVTNMADSESREPIKPSQRRQALLDHVLRVGSAQLDELATLFGVSRMTIHRDVDWLVEQGVVRKVYGGVTARPSNVVESNFLSLADGDAQ